MCSFYFQKSVNSFSSSTNFSNQKSVSRFLQPYKALSAFSSLLKSEVSKLEQTFRQIKSRYLESLLVLNEEKLVKVSRNFEAKYQSHIEIKSQ